MLPRLYASKQEEPSILTIYFIQNYSNISSGDESNEVHLHPDLNNGNIIPCSIGDGPSNSLCSGSSYRNPNAVDTVIELATMISPTKPAHKKNSEPSSQKRTRSKRSPGKHPGLNRYRLERDTRQSQKKRAPTYDPTNPRHQFDLFPILDTEWEKLASCVAILSPDQRLDIINDVAGFEILSQQCGVEGKQPLVHSSDAMTGVDAPIQLSEGPVGQPLVGISNAVMEIDIPHQQPMDTTTEAEDESERFLRDQLLLALEVESVIR